MAILASDELADYLLCESRERGELLTHLKLQKLAYYAQAWWLALYNESLIEENFQAWVHGPVLSSQYERFKGYRWQPISEEVKFPSVPQNVGEHLNQIVDIFGVESAIALEKMSHQEEPWLEARGDLAAHAPSRRIISKETMRRFYASLA